MINEQIPKQQRLFLVTLLIVLVSLIVPICLSVPVDKEVINGSKLNEKNNL